MLYEDSGYEQGDLGFYTEIECTLSSAE